MFDKLQSQFATSSVVPAGNVPAIGVLPACAVQQPTTLVCKEKVMSWTGDDFSGRLVEQSLRGSYEAHAPDGTQLFEVQGHMKLIGSMMTAKFVNKADNQPMMIQVEGNWRDKVAVMRIAGTGQEVARLNRKTLTAANIFADQQTYFVEVVPGVDLVLIAALAVVYDERNNESQS
ncbi:hypothetical protein EMMF5_002239 [Cystobasidiomycetes sp. EMM_F5]